LIVQIVDQKVGDLYSCSRIQQDNFRANASTISNLGPANIPLRYDSYEKRRDDFNTQAPNFNNCMNALDRVVNIVNLDDSPYLLSYWAGKFPEYKELYKGLYDELWSKHWTLFQELVQRHGGSLNSELVAILNPSPTQVGLEIKRKDIFENSTKLPMRFCKSLANMRPDCKNDAEFNSVFGSYYSAEGTAWVSRLVADFDPYWTLRKDDNLSLKSVEDLQNDATIQIDQRRNTKLERQWLEIAATRLDIAIGQRALLSGDTLIPYIYDYLDNPNQFKTANADEQAKLHDLMKVVLSLNPVLAHNLALYGLREQVLTPRTEEINGKKINVDEITLAVRYHFAMSASKNDDGLLKKLSLNPAVFGFKWLASNPTVRLDTASSSIENTPEGWCFNVLETCVPLPKIGDLELGRFEQLPDLNKLLDLRAELLDRLTLYSVNPSLTSSTVKKSIAAGLIFQLLK
jgi:hypothetical protein